MKNILTEIAVTVSAMFTWFLIFLPVIPLASLFFLWLWNAVVAYLHVPHTITYWKSLKLCFLIYIIRGLFGMKINMSRSESLKLEYDDVKNDKRRMAKSLRKF